MRCFGTSPDCCRDNARLRRARRRNASCLFVRRGSCDCGLAGRTVARPAKGPPDAGSDGRLGPITYNGILVPEICTGSKPASSGWRNCGFDLSGSNEAPVFHIAIMITASFLATATRALRNPIFVASRRPQVRNELSVLIVRSSTVAAVIRCDLVSLFP